MSRDGEVSDEVKKLHSIEINFLVSSMSLEFNRIEVICVWFVNLIIDLIQISTDVF